MLSQLAHFPINCRCQSDKWMFHATYIKCSVCGFKEHFDNTDTILTILARMKMQGCFFLDQDRGKADRMPVQLSMYNYR